MVQLDERAAQYGVTFLDDSSDDAYFLGMNGVHAVLESFTEHGWFDPASPADKDLNFEKFKPAPQPVIDEHNGQLHYVHIKAKTPTARTQTMVILHGFTEMAEHMEEVSYYFWQAGYDVWILEQRGHGRSPRDVADLGLIWIDDFRRYVADAEKLIRTVVRPYAAHTFSDAAKVNVYAHSMGGGVATAMAQHAPGLADRYVLSAPMIAPITGMADWQYRAFAAVLSALSSKKRVFVQLNQKEFNKTFDEEGAKGLNHARALWLHTRRLKSEKNQMYAAAYGWVHATVKLTDYILDPAHVAALSDPILLFQSENDAYVRIDAQDKFVDMCTQAGKNIRKVVMKGARHELESEKPEIFHEMFDTILEFLDENREAGESGAETPQDGVAQVGAAGREEPANK